MRTNVLWKVILVLVITGLSIFFFFNNGLKLGLDLEGGVHLVMIMDPTPSVDAAVNADVTTMKEQLTKSNVPFDKVYPVEERGVLIVEGTNPNLGPEVDRICDVTLSRYDFSSRPGGQFALTLKDFEIDRIEEDAIAQAVEVVRNRIDKYGVSEPVINRQMQSNRIIVQLPGVEDSTEVKRLIGRAANLEWKLEVDPIGGAPTQKEILDFYGGTLPADVKIVPGNAQKYNGDRFFALKNYAPVTGADLQQVGVEADEFGQPSVGFLLTPTAGERFKRFTGENIKKPLAIVLDGVVITDPVINDAIPDRGIISGNFSQREARELVLQLKSGSLPAIPKFAEERTVGPSLGLDSIRKGTLSGLWGMALVLVFMLLYYRASGINANICLILNFVILMGIMSIFGLTLTVPGIAGMVLTIGMAIDANVLIFERIKEELLEKKTLQTAIANGFGKAFITIFDSNVTTLIAALFLLEFGSGPVRGFAVTLTVGLLASMFTAVFVSRMIYELVIGFRSKGGKPPTTLSIGPLNILKNIRIPFMKYRLIFACLSLILLAVFGWSYFTHHLNLGIDFRGGEEMQIRFNHPVEVRDLEASVREGTEGSLSLVRYGDPEDNEILIRMSASDAEGNLLDEDALAERGHHVMQNLRNQEMKDAIAAGKRDINTSNKGAIEALIMAAFRTGELSGEDAQAKQLSEAVSEFRTQSGGVLSSLDELKQVSGMTDAMFGYLSEKLTVGEFAVMRIDTVGPTVGEELKKKTWQAIIGALIGILLYIWFRFQFRFSLGAIVALVHDTLMAVGLVSLFQVEINLPTIAAFLTVVGYSTNDTIVVFDRIREHMKRARKQEDVELFNKAINETLSRTLITSLTTFFVVLCMLLFGGEVLFSFSFVLCAGIVVGTYSSIFVASPAVLLWNQLGLQKYFTRKKGKR